MQRTLCQCANGQCHTCQSRAMQMIRCPGCKHWFCPICMRGLGEMRACQTCAVIWLEVTLQLTMSPTVSAWLDEVTLPKGSSEVW